MSNPHKLTSNGAVLWESADVVCIATGLVRASQNRKTGAMVQTWILRRDIAPTEAIATGADKAICGDCPHRKQADGSRTCYVNAGQAPQAIWRAYRAGSYPHATEEHWAAMADQAIRFGAYGDPAFVPLEIWQRLASIASLHTGYTHQWRALSADWNTRRYDTRPTPWANLLMASADCESDLREARALGWRSFVVVSDTASLPEGTVWCPAAPEGGERTQCADCGLCAGASARARDIAIVVHGSGSKHFERRLRVVA